MQQTIEYVSEHDYSTGKSTYFPVIVVLGERVKIADQPQKTATKALEWAAQHYIEVANAIKAKQQASVDDAVLAAAKEA